MSDSERFLLCLNALEDILAIAEQRETLSNAYEVDRLLSRVEGKARDALKRLEFGMLRPSATEQFLESLKPPSVEDMNRVFGKPQR